MRFILCEGLQTPSKFYCFTCLKRCNETVLEEREGGEGEGKEGGRKEGEGRERKGEKEGGAEGRRVGELVASVSW